MTEHLFPGRDVPFITSQEALHEEKLFVDKSKKLTISMDGSGTTTNNFIEDPYIKIYRTLSPNKNTPAIRISLNKDNGGPKYIVHNNQNDTLSSKEEKWLDDVMKNCISNGDRKYKGKDMWDAVKSCIKDKSTNATKDQEDKVDKMEIPDFIDIKPAK